MAEQMQWALFGLHWLQNTDLDTVVRQAQLAEAAGFEALWVGDHIALPASSGEQPRLEAIVALSYLAAITKQIRLGVGVIVLPQRHPVLLAKQLASLDMLSNGRLTIGVGVGYVEAELHALGVSLADRGVRTDEYLAAMLTLWNEAPASFTGRFVSFADVSEHPQPLQRPHPALIIGGHSSSAYRRAIQHGNGWYGWALDLDQTAQALRAIQEAARRYERPSELGELEISITPPGTVDIKMARRYAEMGVHRLVVRPATMDGAAIDDLIKRVAETLIGRV